MKKNLVFFVVFLSLLFCVTGCNKKKEVLHVYTWEGYLSEDIVEKFEKEYNCEVKIDIFPSNEEMYAKLCMSGSSGYDIIIPSAFFAKPMYEQGMIEKLDLTKLPNATKHFDTQYNTLLMDPDMEYSVVLFFSFSGIAYNAEKVNDFKPTWRMFEREDLKGKMTLLDDLREVLMSACKTLGYDANTTDQKQVDEAVSLVRAWRKNIAKFGVDDSLDALGNNEFFLIHTYNGDALQVMKDNEDIRFVIPEEGGSACPDVLCLLKTSQNKELAYKFINYLYDTEVAAENMEIVQYFMPHKEALLRIPPELRDNPVFNVKEIKNSSVFEVFTGEDKIKYDKAWDEIKK